MTVRMIHQTSPIFDATLILDEAARVLDNESEALSFLKKSLNENFSKAVETIFNISGRLIVSGIGKSGHVARKTAATLSSTGQQAYFVHAGEASHGDLGMIGRDDALLMFSFSGETEELRPMLAYGRRFGLPIIAVTRNPESALGRYANLVITLPDVEEACPMKLSPTTSTTMMMALGDAIAVCLLKLRGFSKEDYGLFHPGGSLGQQLTTVRDKMHQGIELPLSSPHMSMTEVMVEMSLKKFGCIGILDDQGKLMGVITDGDLRRFMVKSSSMDNILARDVMKQNPIVIRKETLMADALRILQEKSITTLFVVDEGDQPIGLIHIHDFLKSGVL